MNNNLYDTQTIKKLREELTSLSSELLSILTERERLETEVTDKVLADYSLYFGSIEDELNNKNTIANIYDKYLHRFNIKLKRGEQIKSEYLQALEHELKQVKKEMNKPKVTNTKEFIENGKKIFTNSVETQNKYSTMFREIVKAIHPDVAGQNRHFTLHWNKILHAYKNKDYETIKIYYNLISNNQENINFDINNDTIEELQHSIKHLKRRIDYEKRYQKRIMNSEPLSFYNDLSNPEWLKHREQIIRNKIRIVDNSIEWYKKILSLIKSGRIVDIETKEEKQFQNDFFEATYSKG